MKYIYELILGKYARCTCLLQSPRSGKFVSDYKDDRMQYDDDDYVSIP